MEKKPEKTSIYYMSPCVYNFRNANYSDRKEISGFLGRLEGAAEKGITKDLVKSRHILDMFIILFVVVSLLYMCIRT